MASAGLEPALLSNADFKYLPKERGVFLRRFEAARTRKKQPKATALPALGPSVPGAPTVESALAYALSEATKAGRWDVVAQLARELEARRLEGSNVVELNAKRAR